MDNIFTICYSRQEANEIGHFIMSKGYEGVQNDSYRYCDLMIRAAFLRNSSREVYEGTFKTQAECAVAFADALIAKLKEGGES